jgi:hypothetical protein
MPPTLTIGSTGAAVKTLQSRLNFHLPTNLAMLSVDGLFGPKTLARVKEFQNNNGLTVDGIAGPKTWGKLPPFDEASAPPLTGCDCATCDPKNAEFVAMLGVQFAAARSSAPRAFALRGPARPMRVSFAAAPSGGPVRRLDDMQMSKVKAVYGNSIDFSTVFVTDKAGLGNRPFTMAFKDSSETVQIINFGTFAPDDDTLIHELAHVWQSQHHDDKFRFMVNAVDSQAGAVVANAAETLSDPDILLHKDHPVQFPKSAYAYTPGLDLDQYAAEQMANGIEQGEKLLRNHVKGIAKGAVDTKNVMALRGPQFGDRRIPGVKF